MGCWFYAYSFDTGNGDAKKKQETRARTRITITKGNQKIKKDYLIVNISSSSLFLINYSCINS